MEMTFGGRAFMNRHILVQLLHMNIFVYTCQFLHIVSIGGQRSKFKVKITKIWLNIVFRP